MAKGFLKRYGVAMLFGGYVGSTAEGFGELLVGVAVIAVAAVINAWRDD